MTTCADGRVNTMTISWGTLGIEWDKPIFTTFVREGRFTREMLDKNPEFTVNVPYGAFTRRILGVAGSKSGRDLDKVKELGLTLVAGDEVNVPAIKELPLTLECKVLYRRLQDKALIPQEIREECYPEHVPSTHPMANKDYHIAYQAEIVKAYIIE